MHIPMTILMTEWLREEQNKLLTKKKRLYLHFDKRIARIDPSLVLDIWDKEKMAVHNFFPLIRTTLKDRKFDVEKRELKNIKTFKIKPRLISYAGHFDSLIYSRYSFDLNQRYNTYSFRKAFDRNIIAYRTNRAHQNTTHYVKEVLDFINLKEECVVFCFDIKGFFDNLNHSKLKKSWLSLTDDNQKTMNSDEYAVFKSVTKFHYVDRDQVYREFNIDPKKTRNYEQICKIQELGKHNYLIQKNPNTFGIPQGTPISAILSNIYMIPFDLAISAWTSQHGGFYRRYSDDILVICDPSHRDELLGLITNTIQERELEIQSEKTEEVCFRKTDNGKMVCEKRGQKSKLVYLGVSFDGQDVDLRQRSLQRYFQKRSGKIKSEVRKAKKYSRLIDKKKILNKYSHKSQKSFVSYARAASGVLDSAIIARRVSQKKTTEQVASELKKRSKKKLFA